MLNQRYPRAVAVYKGEGRIVLIPWIDHCGGYRVITDKFYVCKCNDQSTIGEKIFEAMKFIDESPECTFTDKELNEIKPNQFNSKYKTWKSFYKNYYSVSVRLFENGELVRLTKVPFQK